MSSAQQPRLPVHAPPGPAQQREVPTTSLQVREPAQHSGAAAPGAQTTDSPRVHGATWHAPPRHTSPPQQSAPDAHGSPPSLQHLPDSHRRAPQHPSLVVHCAAVRPQHRVAPPRAAHSRPAAQHATAPGVQALASATEHGGGRHTPPEHASPAQQSASLAQVSADVRHTQRPPAQPSRPQHSAALEHAPSAARQHTAAPAGPAQASPPQQADAAAQGAPTMPHADTTRAHRPRSQARPATHGLPPAQHACDSAPQDAAAQAPPAQRPPAAHATPHAPQCLASPRRSTHPAAQQVSPPRHAPPAQHDWPTSPQAVGGRAQTPLASHASPGAQGLPAEQHACASAPHATRGMQDPARQSKPDAHRSSLQHDWPP
jgi:hypothetical protein